MHIFMLQRRWSHPFRRSISDLNHGILRLRNRYLIIENILHLQVHVTLVYPLLVGKKMGDSMIKRFLFFVMALLIGPLAYGQGIPNDFLVMPLSNSEVVAFSPSLITEDYSLVYQKGSDNVDFYAIRTYQCATMGRGDNYGKIYDTIISTIDFQGNGKQLTISYGTPLWRFVERICGHSFGSGDSVLPAMTAGQSEHRIPQADGDVHIEDADVSISNGLLVLTTKNLYSSELIAISSGSRLAEEYCKNKGAAAFISDMSASSHSVGIFLSYSKYSANVGFTCVSKSDGKHHMAKMSDELMLQDFYVSRGWFGFILAVPSDGEQEFSGNPVKFLEIGRKYCQNMGLNPLFLPAITYQQQQVAYRSVSFTCS
ncbi:hypothetical protein EV687_2556 [Corticibacter populi]|nr:hypothetical protein EV687_2556 [Corticibacter populi]